MLRSLTEEDVHYFGFCSSLDFGFGELIISYIFCFIVVLRLVGSYSPVIFSINCRILGF